MFVVSGLSADAGDYRVTSVATGLGGERDDLTPRPPEPTSWDIYLARYTPAKLLGTVEAVDADAAIAEAAKLYDVPDPRQLMAVRRR